MGLIVFASCFIASKNQAEATMRLNPNKRPYQPFDLNGRPINKHVDKVIRPHRYQKNKRSNTDLSVSSSLFDTTNNNIVQNSIFYQDGNELVTIIDPAFSPNMIRLAFNPKTNKQTTSLLPKNNADESPRPVLNNPNISLENLLTGSTSNQFDYDQPSTSNSNPFDFHNK